VLLTLEAAAELATEEATELELAPGISPGVGGRSDALELEATEEATELASELELAAGKAPLLLPSVPCVSASRDFMPFAAMSASVMALMAVSSVHNIGSTEHTVSPPVTIVLTGFVIAGVLEDDELATLLDEQT
jgi:hypothetical protein